MNYYEPVNLSRKLELFIQIWVIYPPIIKDELCEDLKRFAYC